MIIRATHHEVCHKLHKLFYKMAKEVDLWQERFDLLLDTNLCEDCIVEKDKLYQSHDYQAAETGIRGKNVIWEAADIPVRLETLVTCIIKTHLIL